MRKKWFSLGCLTSFILLMLFLFFLGRAMVNLVAKQTKRKTILPNSTLYINIKGEIPEYSIINENIFGKKQQTIHTIIEKINAAKDDPDISNILIAPSFLAVGYANLDELTDALKDFKKSKKKVYAYLEMASTRDYYLASVADKIYLNPSASAGILLKGIGINAHFYKKLLDKIGIEVNVIHAGKYKGYGENYSRTKFSEPVKRNLDLALSGIYQNILKDIATNRKIPIEDIKKIFEDRNNLFINKDYAIKSKLVDVLMQKDDMLDQLNIDSKHMVRISAYSRKINYFDNTNKIAVVYAEGPIMSSAAKQSPYKMVITSKRYNKIFKNLMKDNSIKAVVIRVNSPGGSALESEIILNSIKKLKAVKPVIISMGNVAASGGYYISSNADYIVAEKYTITGSIGVVAMLPKAKKMADKIGITTDKIHKGKYIGLFDFFDETNQETIDMMRKNIMETYSEFKTRVSQGRKIPIDKVEEIAQGQIWNSKYAKNNKLVDEIGNLNVAINKAKSIAKLEKWSLEYYPKQKSYFEYLLENNFNINVISNLANHTAIKDFKLEEAYQTYEMIRTDYIQMFCPAKVN